MRLNDIVRVAIVYDRVNKWGGAERVLLVLHKMFPDAPLYTSVYNPATAGWAKVFPEIKTSFLQRFPLAKTRHDLYAVLMPLVFESFDFSRYNLVISVTSEAAKGIITKPGTLHICYCLTPTRYLWSGYNDYIHTPLRRTFLKPAISYLKRWDKIAAQRPDMLIGISNTVSDRIKTYHNRTAPVIYPPVESHTALLGKQSEYYLMVSRLVPYKKVDLAIRVFNLLKKPLVIVGTGSEERRLKKTANENIVFAGFVSEEKLAEYYHNCRALIFPQEEDFGIAAVEAQMAGKPVIAYKKGGAAETVVEGETGIFFDKQTPENLIEAINIFENRKFSAKDCWKNAQKFSERKFLRTFDTLISNSGY